MQVDTLADLFTMLWNYEETRVDFLEKCHEADWSKPAERQGLGSFLYDLLG